jgi:hypothetical protein
MNGTRHIRKLQNENNPMRFDAFDCLEPEERAEQIAFYQRERAEYINRLRAELMD